MIRRLDATRRSYSVLSCQIVPILFAVAWIALAPRIAAAADERTFDYRELKLDNGLRAVTLEDFSCPIVAVQLWYHVGSKDENPERQGFAHMFEHMMFRGTDRLGPTDHFDFIRRVGGDCNAFTAFDNTTYVQELPANQLELALWLEAERMAFLKIDQTAFDTERKVVEEERRLGLNRPFGTMPEKVLGELFKQHPYRWTPIGRINHLRSAAVQELRDFWTRFYVPNNATLVIVGAVKHDEAQALAKKCFGWIPKYPDPPRVTVRDPMPTEARSIKIKEDNAPVSLTGVIYRTVPVGHKDYVPLQMLASILGGGQSSRIYRELVAEKQLAVMAIAAAFSLEQDGLFAVGAALSPFGGDTDKIQGVVDKQVERLRNEPVSEDELTKARNQMLRGLVTQNLTVVSKANVLGNAATVRGDLESVNRELDEIRGVSAADLQRVASEYLAPQRAAKMTVQRNLLGAIFGGKKKDAEEDSKITATPETEAPPPGRAGLARPAGYPEKAPMAGLLDVTPAPGAEKQSLPNGLKVVVVENHELPYVTVQMGFQGGAWTEAKPGAASLAAGMLDKGTATRSEAEMAKELDTYGISLGGSGDMDAATVNASCLTEHVDRAVTLMADAIRSPRFEEGEFEKLRKQVRTGLAVSAAEPGYIADREMRARLYGEHPYSRTATGELKDLDAVKLDDVKHWWNTYARPEHATLYFAGDIDPAKAMDLAKDAFAEWKNEQPLPEVKMPAVPKPSETHIYLVNNPGGQSQIRVAQIGITRDHPDFFVGTVLSGYFGGAFNARLNETIRVKKGLTYGASGGFRVHRFSGEFEVSTFSKTESTAEAVKAAMDELRRLKTEGPSSKELDDTKSYIVGSFAGDRETPSSVVRDMWNIELNGLPADYYQRMLKAVAAASADDCLRLANSAVNPDKMVIVVVGNATKIKADLEKIAPVTVIGGQPTTAESKGDAANAKREPKSTETKPADE